MFLQFEHVLSRFPHMSAPHIHNVFNLAVCINTNIFEYGIVDYGKSGKNSWLHEIYTVCMCTCTMYILIRICDKMGENAEKK